MPRLIGVIGSSRVLLGSPECGLAYQVGKLLAERGAILICGGGPGVMESACKGASDAGGMTVGILPGTDSGEANPFVKIPVATGMGELRNGIIARASEALIAIGGGAGTLSEIGFAAKIGRPVFGLNTFEIRFQDADAVFLTVVSSPEEAVDAALRGA